MNGSQNNRTKPIILWSKEEFTYLSKGVKRYGIKNWKKILQKYPFNAVRTPHALYNQYHRQQEIKYGKKRKPTPQWTKGQTKSLCRGVNKYGLILNLS